MGAIRTELKIMLEEEKIRARIAMRTPFEKTKLLIMRTITLALSGVVLLVGWGIIIALAAYDKPIKKFLNSYKYLAYVSSWFSSVLTSIVNDRSPALIKVLTKIEAWDFQE